MSRVLTLTSPYTKGEDVERVQRAAVTRLTRKGIDAKLVYDGEYGPATHQIVLRAAEALGVDPVAGSTKAARRRVAVILRPTLRTPAELRRSRKRAKARKTAGSGLRAALAWAAAQVGTVEQPPGSNRGPKITKWLARVGITGGGAPWCGAFAVAVGDVYGVRLTSDVRYCPSIRGHAQAGTGGLERWTTDPKTAQKAIDDGRLALVVYTFGGSVAQHVGVAKQTSPSLDTYEGNTSFQGRSGSQSDGGAVAHRTDRTHGSVQGYAICRRPETGK